MRIFSESKNRTYGVAFLHVLLTAAHLVLVQANDCGLRHLCWFRELSGLDEFIAESYGSQQATSLALAGQTERAGPAVTQAEA